MSNVEWLISRDPDKTLQLLISTAAELNNDHVLSLLAERPLHIIAFLEELVVSISLVIIIEVPRLDLKELGTSTPRLLGSTQFFFH